MIKKGFERRFILKFAGIVVAGTGLVTLSLYLALPGHEITNYAESIRSFIRGHSSLPTSMTKAYLVGSIVTSVIIVLVAVFTSHKIAGPVYRLKTALNGLLTTLRAKPLTFRKGDQLEDAASGFNAMLKGLEDRFGAIISAYEEADRTRKRLDDSEQAVREMRDEVEKLGRAIGKFDV